MMKSMKGAFTLIELLIVVAIIAILAAIAVPNFLEAQTRAKISRAKADMRTIHTGLETYRIDHNTIPLMNYSNFAFNADNRPRTGHYNATLERLTSPIAYLNGRGTFSDPFPARYTRRMNNPNQNTPPANEHERKAYSEYFYVARGVHPNSSPPGETQHVQWGDTGARVQWAILQSSGPELRKWFIGTEMNSILANDTPGTRAVSSNLIYNATNGTVSGGTVIRIIGQPVGRGSVLGNVVLQLQD